MTFKKHRIAIMAEGKFSALSAKTAAGVIRYSPHDIVAVVDSTQAGKTVQDALGYGGATPIVASVSEALQFNPDVLLIGIAPTGGQLPDEWRHAIAEGIENHLEIWSGLHSFLSDDEEFVELAALKGVRLWDVRQPANNLDVGMGRALKAKAYVVLTVGSDCNVGKMTAALELQKFANQRGYKAGFVATGQTGILIEGEGTPLDAVPGDFMSGEVERLVMDWDEQGVDVIFVEGQGALLHPGFGSVTLGLLLGAMPDGFVLVHQPSRQYYRPDYDVPLPDLRQVIASYENLMVPYKNPRVLAVTLNTFDMTPEEANRVTQQIENDLGYPTADPFRHGVERIWAALEPYVKKKRDLRR